MELKWIRVGIGQIDTLVATRVEVLRAANLLPADADLSRVEATSRAYYLQALPSGEHAALLAYDGDRVIATGGVSFYQVMPTCHNPSGYKAYIMNMYTHPYYRHRGIARRMLEMLVEACRERGITHITLEATAAGRPLYERCGFVAMKDEMILEV